MTKKGIILIVVSAIIFIVNFMTLWNQTFVANATANKIGMLIGLLSAIGFVLGLGFLITGLVKKN